MNEGAEPLTPVPDQVTDWAAGLTVMVRLEDPAAKFPWAVVVAVMTQVPMAAKLTVDPPSVQPVVPALFTE
jgi:hypothetical protein